jgi:hypothetical protein
MPDFTKRDKYLDPLKADNRIIIIYSTLTFKVAGTRYVKRFST